MTDEIQVGGTDWELREAERMMIEARTPAARALAMRRHSEAVRNMMQNTLVPSFEKAVSVMFARQIADLAKQFEPVANGQIDVASRVHRLEKGLQKQIDARFDAFSDELGKVAAAAQEGAVAIKKLASDVAGLKVFEDESRADRTAMHGEIAELRAEVVGIRATIEPYMAGNRRAELDEALRKIARLEERLALERGDGVG